MTASASASELAGVMPAALTPLNDDLSVDHARLVQHTKWLLANGCDAVAIMGTTGEANSFSVDERFAIFDAIAEAGLAGNRVLMGTGCCAFPDTVALTKRALANGAPNVLMLPPFYYKNVSDDGLFASYSEVIQRVGDARLRIYVYHFPGVSQIPLGIPLLERLTKAFPQTIVGVKDSSDDFANMKAMIEALPGFRVFSGTERYLLDVLKIGGVGTISASVNVDSIQAGEVMAAWRAKSADVEARQQTLTALRMALQKYPFVPALKAVMARHTGHAGWATMRPPQVALKAEAQQALFKALDELSLKIAKAGAKAA